MNLNRSSDYLTYKKSKMNPNRVQRVEKRIEKVKRVVKLSLVTFCVMFLCVVVFIKKYAKRVDIEYGRQGVPVQEASAEQAFSDAYDPDKRAIDKRLSLIQQEENAPSESRVLEKDRDKNEVMNFEQFELIRSKNTDDDIDTVDTDLKKIEQRQEEKPKPQPVKKVSATNSVQPKLLPKMQTPSEDELNITQKGDYAPVELQTPSNIKVLVGKYASFEDAKSAQLAMKAKAKTVPFIRKIGSDYSLQIGSYSNMDVARNVAGNYSSMGFDAWIYQQ